jgi:hypothetical protein
LSVIHRAASSLQACTLIMQPLFLQAAVLATYLAAFLQAEITTWIAACCIHICMQHQYLAFLQAVDFAVPWLFLQAAATPLMSAARLSADK